MAQDPDIAKKAEALASEAPVRDAAATRDRTRAEVSRVARTPGYVRIWVDVPPAWRARLERPAQYVTVKFDDSKHRFLVVANDAWDAREEGFELLVEPNEDLDPILAALEPGTSVTISAPEGPGFPIEGVGAAYLFATGSGIAALRPVLTSWRRGPHPDEVVLFYEEGPSNPHAFRAEFEELARSPWFHAVLTHDPGGESGHVDETFARRLRELDALPDAHIMMCGAPPMLEAVTRRWLEAGGDPERLLTNI